MPAPGCPLILTFSQREKGLKKTASLCTKSSYRIDLKGAWLDGSIIHWDYWDETDGTLRDPYLQGIYNETGNVLAGTRDNNSGDYRNSQVDFTPAEDGTCYVAAMGYEGIHQGTCTLSMEEVM